jgi:hypothetical protein
VGTAGYTVRLAVCPPLDRVGRDLKLPAVLTWLIVPTEFTTEG